MDSTLKGYTNGGFEYANRHNKRLQKMDSPNNITNMQRFNLHYPKIPNSSEIDVRTVEPRFVRGSQQLAINDTLDNRSNAVDSLNNNEKSISDGRYIEIFQDSNQVYLFNLGLINNKQSLFICMKKFIYL